MLSISAMSYPQLSAQAHLALLYIHIKLANQGTFTLLNSGSGGAGLHIALLENNAKELANNIISWSLNSNEIKKNKQQSAKIRAFIEILMQERDNLFKRSQEIKKVQIIAQIPSPINYHEAINVNWSKLKMLLSKPYIVMV